MTFPEKLLQARLAKNLSQIELGQMAGINARTIYTYEKNGVFPRRAVLERLAEALDVTAAYLMDDGATDPRQDLAQEMFITSARGKYGSKGARDAQRIIGEASALFAGGELDEESKDLFFQSLTNVYFSSKEEARRKFTPKRRKSRKE